MSNDLKILWLSENNFFGKIDNKFENMRTDFAWFYASNGIHCPIKDIYNIIDKYDIAIIILPKNLNHIDVNSNELINNMKRIASKIGWMQEGNITYFQNYEPQIQMWYINFLTNMDFLLVHNEIDKNYFSGIFLNKQIFINKSLIIPMPLSICDLSNRKGIIIGGNMTEWYGGIDSYIISLEIDENITAPSMGRMNKNEIYINGLNHLPYLSWINWIEKLSEFKYAIHWMRTVAAGTFSLNCSMLGIPCIGNIEIDTQRILHPDLSFYPHEILKAREILYKLKYNESFYMDCFYKTKKLYSENYSIEIWKNTFQNNMNEVLINNG